MVANDGVKTNSPRKFGADIVGDIAWGTHLCQFYQTKQDMIDILVPYFVEGLRNNEFCMWITSLPLEVAEAKEELRKAVPDLDNCIQRGQIDIRPYTDWYLIDGQFNADKVLEEWLRKEKEALSRGFEGLRLTGNTFWIEKADWKNFVDYEAKINNVIGTHKMIALCTYSLEKCTGEDVADVIKNHVGTLIRKGKTWNLVEDVVQRKTVEFELRDSEKKYRSLFKNMPNGLAYHKVLFGNDGKPVDYVFLEVNDAFERLTGLRREGVVGRKVTDVFHDGGKDVEDLIGIYGKVVMTGEISQFDLYFSPLEKWYQIMAYCPEREFFIVSFQDITDHKRAEEDLRQSEEKHRSLFDSMTQGVVYQETSGNITSANHAAEMMLGLSLDEMMGRTSSDPRWRAIHEDGSDFPSDSRPAAVALRSGVPVRNVIVGVYNTKSKEYRWLKVDAVPQFRLEENRPYQVYTLFDDVTDRKKAEEALKENEAILHSFFESPGAIRGILEIVGDNVRLVSHNREAASFYGWRDRSVDGEPLGEIGFTKEEERSWVENLNNARLASRPWSFEYARDTDSGRQWVLFTIGRIEIETTTNPSFAFDGTDITRRKQIENESRETRDYLDSLLNYANAPIIVWDSEFKVTRFNHAFERLTGLSSNEVVGKNLEILFPQEKKEEAMAHILRTLGGEYWEAVEIPIMCPDGTVRTALWNSANIYDAGGKKVVATIAQGQDITERKRAEEEAFRLASFPKLNPNPVVEMDLDGNLCYLNPAAEMMLPGLKESSLDHPFFRDWQHVIQTLQKEKKNSFSREVRIGDKWFYQLIHFVPETNRVRVYSTNIDSLKQVENQHREIRDYLENLLDYANAPIIVWDSEFRITRFNHAFERLTGLSSNDAIGKPLEILFPATQREEAMNHILDTLKGEYWEAVEIPIMRTDGTVRTALWNSANVYDANSKKIIATIAQGQDITERKKLEEKLKIAERMAGIGETAAMVGHDIRNPLQAILGYCSVVEELLNVETNDESHRKKLMEIFEQVKDQVRYTDKIVSDLRDYSTPVTPVPVRTDLRQLIEESRSLSHIPQIVSVSVSIPKTFHNAKVDPSILKRVLVNLITNAVQAMPNGGRLSVKVARRKNPATLVLTMKDTGIGIPREDRPKMFVPLFTTKAKGQGLGLAVCKRLIEAHDGTITFKSQTGKGSQFIIKIPLKKDR